MTKFDFHVHVTDNSVGVEDSIRSFADYCSRNKLEGICIHAAEYSSKGDHPDCNEKALAVSKGDSNWFAFAGLHHDRNFVEQAKVYMAQGFRGIKLMEGKPSYYRHYGYGLEHPRFEPFFAYAEENAIPLLVHNNDPAHHWDINKVSSSTIEKGWYYDETMPSQEHFFTVLEGILEAHPMLHAAIAHLGFYSNDLPRAQRLMEKHPNLYLDATPAPIIFDELSQAPEQAKAFLEKFQDRLIWGTDVSNRIEGKVLSLNEKKLLIMESFYEGSGDYTIGSHRVRGMELDEAVLEKIYRKNAFRFMGISV